MAVGHFRVHGGSRCIPLVLLVSRAGPTTTAARSLAIAATVAGFAASLLWLARWPTRSQSVAYSITCCVSIAAACLMIPNPYGGLMGCTAFAALGGFIAYFHALRHVLINFLVAMGCAAVHRDPDAGRARATTRWCCHRFSWSSG